MKLVLGSLYQLFGGYLVGDIMKNQITVWEMNGVMNSGGTESLIMEILRHKPSDINIMMIVHSGNKNFSGVYDQEIIDLGIPVYTLPSVGSVGLFGYIKAFQKLIDEVGKPDIIHSHINGTGGFICYAAYLSGIDVRIVHCHADIKFTGSRLYRYKEELLLLIMKIFVSKYGTDFWACSKAAGNRLFGNHKPFTIIPNIIDVKKYERTKEKIIREKKKLGISDNRIVIGMVGRIARIKNYTVVIEALKMIRDNGINAYLYCYGRINDADYYKELSQLIQQLHLEKYVKFKGNSLEIENNIAAFDVFAMPSYTEGLGIAALEAQAAGLPTVLSTGVPDETDINIGLVFRANPTNPTQWAEKIMQAITISTVPSKKIRDAFIRKGYDSDTTCKKIIEKYIKLCE